MSEQERIVDAYIEAQCSKCGYVFLRPTDDATGIVQPLNATLRIQCANARCREVNLVTWSLRNYLKLMKERG